MATQTEVELQPLEFEPISINTAPSVSRSVRGPTTEQRDEFVDEIQASITAAVLSKPRSITVIIQLIGIQLFTSFSSGVVVVGLPAIADTLGLEAGLLLWPTSIFYLTAGSFLMLAGSIADAVGTKRVMLGAGALLTTSALGCGLARTGGELIAFRGLQGIGSAAAMPASVSIVSTSIENGRPRNLGFACLGFSGPLGFLIGLVLGGALVDTVGWQPAFYLAAASIFVLCSVGAWLLPQDPQNKSGRLIGKQLALGVDWVGLTVASTGLATLSYVLA